MNTKRSENDDPTKGIRSSNDRFRGKVFSRVSIVVELEFFFFDARIRRTKRRTSGIRFVSSGAFRFVVEHLRFRIFEPKEKKKMKFISISNLRHQSKRKRKAPSFRGHRLLLTISFVFARWKSTRDREKTFCFPFSPLFIVSHRDKKKGKRRKSSQRIFSSSSNENTKFIDQRNLQIHFSTTKQTNQVERRFS